MAGSKQQVVISVLADTKRFKRAFNQLANDSGFNKLKSGLQTFGKVAAASVAAATAALGAFGAKAVSAASDLEQSMGGVETVFKQNAQTVKAWAAQAATSVGLSQAEYGTFASLLGSQLKNLGFDLDTATTSTNDLIGMAADLSATFGGTTADAVEALSAAFRGEYDSIEKYGMSFKAADVEAKMAAEGLSKAEAIVALLGEQGADAAGGFARETDTFAHQTQVLKAQWENFAATMGTYLLPIVTAVVTTLNDRLAPAVATVKAWVESELIPAVKDLAAAFQDRVLPRLEEVADRLGNDFLGALKNVASWIQDRAIPALSDFGKWLSRNRDWLLPLASAIGAFVATLKTMSYISTVTTAVKGLAAAFKALSLTSLLSPWGLVAAAVAAVAAGLVYLWKNNEGFRNGVIAAWNAVKNAVAPVADWFKTYVVPLFEAAGELLAVVFAEIRDRWVELWSKVKAAWQVVGPPIVTAVKTYFTNLGTILKGIWNNIVTVVSAAWNVIRTVIQTALTLLSNTFRVWKAVFTGDWQGAWNIVKSSFATVWNAVKSIASTVWNAIRSIFSNNLATISGVWSNTWNGIRSVFSGVWDGIKSAASGKISSLVSQVRGIRSRITGAFAGASYWLWSAGRNIISGLLNGLVSRFESVKSWVNGVGSWIARHKGPKSYDLKLLVPAGKWIMQGLSDGLLSQLPALEKTLDDVTGTITGTNWQTPAGSLAGASGVDAVTLAALLQKQQTGTASVSLTAGTIQAIALAVKPHLFLDGKQVAQSAAKANSTSTAVGAA